MPAKQQNDKLALNSQAHQNSGLRSFGWLHGQQTISDSYSVGTVSELNASLQLLLDFNHPPSLLC